MTAFRSDILRFFLLFQCLGGTIHSVLLHLFGHVSIFDDGFSVRHLEIFLTFSMPGWHNPQRPVASLRTCQHF